MDTHLSFYTESAREYGIIFHKLAIHDPIPAQNIFQISIEQAIYQLHHKIVSPIMKHAFVFFTVRPVSMTIPDHNISLIIQNGLQQHG